MLEILSLGAGVQSTALLLMSCEGELPKLDHAIFADTGWEPQAVYDHFNWLSSVAKKYGIPIHVVSNGNIRDDALSAQVAGASLGMTKEQSEAAKARGAPQNKGRWASMPLFTLDNESDSLGMIRRQCTSEYKIKPIEKFIRREILGLKPRQHAPKEPVMRQWRGISIDEWQRVRESDHKWMTVWHPLVDQRISRNGCHKWMEERGYPEPPRSSCLGCPFHHDREWRHIRDNSPEEWAEVVVFDKAIRKCGGMRGDVFLHSQRVPLDEVDLRTDADRGQLSLWQDECSGMCGV